MKRTQRSRLLMVAAAGALVIAACGSDSGDTATEETTAEASADTTVAEEATEDTAAAAGSEAWVAPVDDCPAEVSDSIEDTVKIGSVLPLSGSTAALVFAPVKDGMEAYIDYANEQGLVPGYTLELAIEDDQYNKDLTPASVDKLLDGGVNLVTGIVGTPSNQAVRPTLNEECVPQLFNLTGDPAWGDIAEYPWTMGGLAPYTTETKIYAADIAATTPGATVAVYYANNEFGQIYADTLDEIAGDLGLEVVESQTVEVGDEAPPEAQLNAIAAAKPDAILAAPLGAAIIPFLTQLANVKASTPGWEPKVYVTNTVASSLILGGAKEAANGIISSGYVKDVGDPAVQAADPNVQMYIDLMTARGKGDIATTAAAGWNAAEVTVAIIAQAAASEGGLTRASIMEAARSISVEPSLARDGVVYRMNGEADPYLLESLQLITFNAASLMFSDIGSVNTDFETK